MVLTSRSQLDRLAGRIAGYMRMLHITDEEMAVVLQITRQTFTKRKKHPETYRIDELLRMCKKFGITLAELVSGREEGNDKSTGGPLGVYGGPFYHGDDRRSVCG